MVSLTEVYDLSRLTVAAVGVAANTAPCPAPPGAAGGRARVLGGLARAGPTAYRALADTPAAGVRATLTVRVPPDPALDPSLLMSDLAARASAASTAVAAALAPVTAAGCAADGTPPLCGFLGRLAVAAGVPLEALASATTTAVSAAALPAASPPVGASGGGALAGGPLAGVVLAALAGCAALLAACAACCRATRAPDKPAAGLSPRSSPAGGGPGEREAAEGGGATLNPLHSPGAAPESSSLELGGAEAEMTPYVSTTEGAAGTVSPQLLRSLQFAASAGRPSARSLVVGRFPSPRSPPAALGGAPGSGGGFSPGASPRTPAELRGTLRG